MKLRHLQCSGIVLHNDGPWGVNEGQCSPGEMGLFKRLQAPEEKTLIQLTIINLPKASGRTLKLLANVILLSLATINSSTAGTKLPPPGFIYEHYFQHQRPRFVYSGVILPKSVITIYTVTTRNMLFAFLNGHKHKREMLATVPMCH